jgi:hypothetical protein
MRETPRLGETAAYAILGYPGRRRPSGQAVHGWALLAKEIVEGRLGLLDCGDVFRDISTFLGLEVVTEIGLILLAHLFGRRLFAVLCLRGVVLHAHLADVELSVARLAHVEPAKRKAQRGEGDAAAPASQGVRHKESVASETPRRLCVKRHQPISCHHGCLKYVAEQRKRLGDTLLKTIGRGGAAPKRFPGRRC